MSGNLLCYDCFSFWLLLFLLLGITLYYIGITYLSDKQSNLEGAKLTKSESKIIFDLSTSILALVSLLIAYSSLNVAREALKVSQVARDDVRAISKLGLEPKLELDTNFRTDIGYPRAFWITNSGPVEALQIEVHLITYRYDGSIIKVVGYGTGTDEHYQADKIDPFRSGFFPFKEIFLDVNARIQKPAQHNAFEIRISYRRPPDMTYYTESAYYFVNPDGDWVNENNGSLVPERYNPIMKAVKSASQKLTLEGLKGGKDWLHPIPEEK